MYPDELCGVPCAVSENLDRCGNDNILSQRPEQAAYIASSSSRVYRHFSEGRRVTVGWVKNHLHQCTGTIKRQSQLGTNLHYCKRGRDTPESSVCGVVKRQFRTTCKDARI